MNWNQGYNVDLGYTYGFYREQDPAWMDLCTLVRGVQPPSLFGTKRLRYLELGCGQGVNLIMLAAVHPEIEFVGVDFNPQHIAHATTLLNASGLTNVSFVEGDFVKLGHEWPSELGKFDYISAHGIYTWIAPSVLKGFIQCIEASSLPGALVYLSYNTHPGWIATGPVQHLLRTWQVREQLPSERALTIAKERFAQLDSANISMMRLLPGIKARVDSFKDRDINYLVQEYLHDNWTPKWFNEVEAELSPIKLRHVASATSSEWFVQALMPQVYADILGQYNDPVEREVMIDVLTNQTFRRDIWARGITPIWTGRQIDALNAKSFWLAFKPTMVASGEFKFKFSLGEVTGNSELYHALYEEFGSGAKSIADLFAVLEAKKRSMGDLLQAIGLMLNEGHVQIHRRLQDPEGAKKVNIAIAQQVIQGAPYRNLIATAHGSVVAVAEMELVMFGLWTAQPEASVAQLGKSLATTLTRLGRSIKKNSENEAKGPDLIRLATQAFDTFLKQNLPRYKSLGIC